jgi:hypothetical protein
MYLQLMRTALAEGLPLERALEILRGAGASPVEAATAVQEATGLPAAEARAAVTQSRAWSAPRSAAQPVFAPPQDCDAIGHHGLSGHGAASVLPHLVRQAQTQGSGEAARR